MKTRAAAPPLNRQVLDEASAWFVDFRVGDADGAARARFDQWLRASPEHIRAYMEIARTYVELPVIKADQKIDVEGLIASTRSDSNVLRLGEAVPTQTSAPERPRLVRIWALAASLIVVASGLGAYSWYYLHRYPTYTTEVGENRSVTLTDGSTVELNARSSVRIEFSKAERLVELLDGQALFEVAKDSSRPFVVIGGAAVVRAVGTQFDVDRTSNGTTVTVVEGRVAVLREGTPEPPFVSSGQAPTASADAGNGRNAPGATFVSAGEQVTVSMRAISAPRPADVAAATAWTQHRLIFDGTPLSEVAEDFNRYNERHIVIEDTELREFHVSGVYISTDPASLIRFLREQPGVEVVETDDAVRIRHK